MVFSSTLFLFLFLPIFFAFYYASPVKLKNLILLIFSLLFYTWGEDILVLMLIISTIVDYSCGLFISKGYRKLGLFISIIFNLAILFSFKYIDFAFENYNSLIKSFDISNNYLLELPKIALPIGISFYTFQTMSYSIDVYRKKIEANRNFLNFATYVTMFPQLVAGPIVRYTDVEKKLESRKVTKQDITIGIERFIIGLGKKVLIANSFASIADDIFFHDPEKLSSSVAWFGAIAYTIQIYFDFSGYSDMAIGLGKMLGFNFPENFNYPYVAKSMKDFWRRWHISLSTWFRDYVYISLGGNRKGVFKTYFNLLIVFFVTGLWHGASWNFIIWGLYHGFFLIIERLGLQQFLLRLKAPIQHIYTLVVVVFGWVLFRADNLEIATKYIWKMLSFNSGQLNLNEYIEYIHINPHTIFFLMIALLFSTPIYLKINSRLFRREWIKQSLLMILFLITVIYLSTDSYNPFIYFRF